MSVSLQPLVPVRANYLCDACGKGRMQMTGLQAVNGDGFLHTCPSCAAQAQLNKPYPEYFYVDFVAFMKDAKNAMGKRTL